MNKVVMKQKLDDWGIVLGVRIIVCLIGLRLIEELQLPRILSDLGIAVILLLLFWPGLKGLWLLKPWTKRDICFLLLVILAFYFFDSTLYLIADQMGISIGRGLNQSEVPYWNQVTLEEWVTRTFAATITGPFNEELLFRGGLVGVIPLVFYRLIQKEPFPIRFIHLFFRKHLLSDWNRIGLMGLTAAILFGWLHEPQSVILWVSFISFGMVEAWIMVRYGLLACWFFHGMSNALIIVINNLFYG